MDQLLTGKVALVAGATRGAGRQIAVQLGAQGATVYVTGRSTRHQRSEMDRAETIEETAELVTAAGGTGIAVQVDHLVAAQVRALIERIDAEQRDAVDADRPTRPEVGPMRAPHLPLRAIPRLPRGPPVCHTVTR